MGEIEQFKRLYGDMGDETIKLALGVATDILNEVYAENVFLAGLILGLRPGASKMIEQLTEDKE